MNIYKKSIKKFEKYIKNNVFCSREEWDNYAQQNCLCSAQTLMFHYFHNDLLKYLNKKKKDKFEYLKNEFLFIPIQYRKMRIIKTLIKISKLNKKETSSRYYR